jgi:lipopolysaccharide export system protein LptA
MRSLGSTRRTLVAGAALLAIAAGCRRSAPRGAPVPAGPARGDTTPVTARDTAARAVATDSARVAALADSARQASDSARATPRARRRTATTPSQRCGSLVFDYVPNNRLQSFSGGPGMPRIAYTGGGFLAHCSAIGNRLRADSAEYYEDQGLLYLIGNVHYAETPRVRVSAQRMTYFQREERLVAEGAVDAVLESGTRMVGPSAEYFRAVAGLRPVSRVVAPGRPVITLVGVAARPGETQRTPDTVTVVANTVVDEGDSTVYASGQVQIVRDDITATSDSATLDNTAEIARLIRNARIDSRSDRPFTLSGAVIDLFSRERQLQRVLSVGEARVVSQDLNLSSDTVDLRVTEGKLERAHAWGPARATATSPDRDVVADSIAVRMPNQRVRELHAVGGAVARTATDTLRIVSTERDVLRGDTLVARFDSTSADTTRNPPVKQIVARGNASSRQQIAARTGRLERPAINYVRGRGITVDFAEGTVGTVTVNDQVVGLYLEPSDSLADSARSRRPAAAAAPPVRAIPLPPATRPDPVPPAVPPSNQQTVPKPPAAAPRSRR